MRPRAGEGSGTLVLFTVCAQAAVGLAFVAALVDAQAERGRVLAVALVLLGIAGLAAFRHLGQPWRVPWTLQNLRRSPLSREIFAGGVFALLLVAVVGVGNAASGGFLAFLTALGGVLFLLAMDGVYRLRTVPAWNTPATGTAFLSTALILGLAIGALLLRTGSDASGGVQVFTLLTAAVVGVDLLVQGIHLHLLERRGGVAAESARIVRVENRGVWHARVATALLGAGVLWAVSAIDKGVGWHRAGTLLAVLLLFASELLGRWLFYAFHRRVGL